MKGKNLDRRLVVLGFCICAAGIHCTCTTSSNVPIGVASDKLFLRWGCLNYMNNGGTRGAAGAVPPPNTVKVC
jgi:hypothetical protein